MASHDSTNKLHNIRITPVIEREFKRRSVFPELRLEASTRVINGATGIYRISIEHAREIMSDAEAQKLNRALPRGLPVAYGALARNISASLKQQLRRGLLDDPGMVEVQRRQAAASACFQVGDSVLYFGCDENGEEAIIINGYEMYAVQAEDGPYITSNDERLEYRHGYVIKLKGGDYDFFVPAYRLIRDDGKPSHLRLVASRLAVQKGTNPAVQETNQ